MISKQSALIRMKAEQFKYIGLDQTQFGHINDIIETAVASSSMEVEQDSAQLWNILNVPNLPIFNGGYGSFPYTVTYNINTGDIHQYNIGSYNNAAIEMLDILPANYSCSANNSFNMVKGEKPDTTNSTRKNTDAGLSEDFRSSSMDPKDSILTYKLKQMQNMLEGISNEGEILITAKPKNRSYKIRKSNRYSRFRGVSLNGKKWQVMIMGPTKKKYFGAIQEEREAAVLYDKLSILTNGLAAKTNFNYRKSDLMKMLPELECMQHIVSN